MIKAILTGHSKGLGLGIAHALLEKGHAVLGVSRSTAPALQTKHPDLLEEMQLDLSCASALENPLLAKVLTQFVDSAGLVLLINNAGAVSPVGPLHTQNPAQILRSIQLNTATPIALSALLTQMLAPTQQLRILHVSSGAGRSAYPGWGVYCASKAALDMHAQAIQMDRLANVKICSLAPGVIDTDMQAEIRQVDEKLFPNKPRFLQLKNDNQLSSPMETGRQLVDYLLAPRFGESAIDDLRSN